MLARVRSGVTLLPLSAIAPPRLANHWPQRCSSSGDGVRSDCPRKARTYLLITLSPQFAAGTRAPALYLLVAVPTAGSTAPPSPAPYFFRGRGPGEPSSPLE